MKHILKSLLMLCALFTAASAWADGEEYWNIANNSQEGWINSNGWYNGSDPQLAERYSASHYELTNGEAIIMYQTLEGLKNGHYTVYLYANASNPERSWEAKADCNDGALGYSFVYANNAEQTIPLRKVSSVATPSLWKLEADVTDGTLTVGMKNKKQGAIWCIIGVKSIKYHGANYGCEDKVDNGSWWTLQRGNATGTWGGTPVTLKENYKDDTYHIGDQIHETISGLENGYYTVGVYATASWTSGRGGLGSTCPVANGGQNATFLYAGGVRQSIPVVHQTSFNSLSDYTLHNVKVTDGTLQVGITNDTEGSNWQCMLVHSLHYMGANPDYSHLLGCTKDDWDGATGTCDRFTPFRMAEFYNYSPATGGALLSKNISGLPVGLYTLKLYCNANLANRSDITFEDGTDTKTVLVVTGAGDAMQKAVKNYKSNNVPEDNMQLFTFEDIEVDDNGTINIAVGNVDEGPNWFTIAGESLVWTGVSLKLLQSSLQNAVDAASLRKEEFMSTATRTALTSAISAAETVLEDEDATEEQLNTALTNLQAAVAAIDTWTENWTNAKKPLIAAMERFEADYNDGANGALRKMSDEAWNTLVTAAGVAATAKDQYEDLTALETAATTFNAAMDAAETSIALYAKYELLMTALNRYNSTAFPKATYDTEANHASDATVTAAIAAMNTAWEDYKQTLEGNQDVTALAGENMGFEDAEDTQSLTPTTNGNHSYAQPNWEMTVTNTTNVWEFAGQTTDIPSNSTSTHSMRVYANWTASGDVMQVKQSTVLPVGNYRLDVSLKMVEKNWNESLNYIEVGNTRYALNAGSDWETVGQDLEIVEPTLVTISFGHVAKGGGNKMDVYVDDIKLTLYNKTTYERYHETAKTMKDGGSASLALASALAQYTEATETGATTAGYDIEVATGVLRNAVAMAEANDNATSLIANPQFASGNADGWIHNDNIPNGRDVSIKKDAPMNQFNVWGNPINYSDLYQQVQNLPNGTYALTANFQTYSAEARKTTGGGVRSDDGYSWISLYADNFDEAADAPRVMRSTNIGHGEGLEDDGRHDYTVYFTVVNNKANVGVRSDYTYYRVTDFRLRMVDAAEHKADVAKAVIYDALFDPAKAQNALEFDLTDAKYADASGVDLRAGGFVQQPNALVKASAAGQIAGDNVIVDGACANLVLTDKASFSASAAFTATSATYTREMANEWGTVILPYAVTSDENVQFYALKKVVEGTDGYMSFVEAETLEANTPGVFVKKDANAGSVTLSGSNVEVAATPSALAAAPGIGDAEGWTLNGVFASTVFEDVTQETGEFYYISSDHFWHATGKLTVAPFRAYFTTATAAASKSFRLVTEADDATEVKLVPEAALDRQEVYTINGIRLADAKHLKPGLYIINGRKVAVKF